MDAVKRAISEGRLIFFPSGQYKYIPSKEYLDKYKNPKVDLKRKQIVIAHLDANEKLMNLNKAFIHAEKTGQKVSHCHNGKIILKAR